eukprot:gene6242-10250_t
MSEETKEKITATMAEGAENVKEKVTDVTNSMKETHEEIKEKNAKEKAEKQKESIIEKAGELYEETKNYITGN